MRDLVQLSNEELNELTTAQRVRMFVAIGVSFACGKFAPGSSNSSAIGSFDKFVDVNEKYLRLRLTRSHSDKCSKIHP